MGVVGAPVCVGDNVIGDFVVVGAFVVGDEVVVGEYVWPVNVGALVVVGE